MESVLVDSNVIIASRFSRDQNHQRGKEITEAFDHGDLPTGRIPSDALEEILNYIHTRASHDDAVETLDKLQESSGFEVVYTQKSDFDAGRSLFRRYEGLSLTDGILAAYMQRIGIDYIYSFDDDFDVLKSEALSSQSKTAGSDGAIDGITRLDTAAHPLS